MTAMVTNRLWWVPVLVLLFTLNNLVMSRYLSRMEREISNNTSTNTSDGRSTNTVPETVMTTTVEHLEALSAQTIEVKTDRPDLNVPVTSTDHQNISDTSHTQQNEGNETSEKHSIGTESVIGSQPTGIESASITQLPMRNDSSGHVSLAGSSAPTFPASLGPSKVTENHTKAASAIMPFDKSTTSALRSTASRTTKKRTSTTEKTPLCFTPSPQRDELVSRCLIAIASMAALTTIFIISTIYLVTKLSGYRYRHKAHLQETEMVCISALMNDTDHPVPKPRHPKSNGALIPNTEDGDPDGDNLTLNSFLPDNDGPL